jgi:hypothetical protein
MQLILLYLQKVTEEISRRAKFMQQTDTMRLSSYKWRENLKQDFINCLDDNESVHCVQRVQSSLQRRNLVGAANIL